VRKQGRALVIDVRTADEQVSIAVPLRTLNRLARKLDGRLGRT